MSESISDEWMKSFSTVWNADEGITAVPGNIGFKPTISYGFKGEKKSFGVAYISKKLQFLAGDNGTMIDNLRIDQPFIKKYCSDGEGIIK